MGNNPVDIHPTEILVNSESYTRTQVVDRLLEIQKTRVRKLYNSRNDNRLNPVRFFQWKTLIKEAIIVTRMMKSCMEKYRPQEVAKVIQLKNSPKRGLRSVGTSINKEARI